MRFTLATAIACLSLGLSFASESQVAIRKPTQIPAQGLGSALQALAKARGLQVLYVSGEINKHRTNGASGDLTSDEALTQLLSGTGLTYRYLGENSVTIFPVSTPSVGSLRNTSEIAKATQLSGDSLLRLSQVDSTEAQESAPGEQASGEGDWDKIANNEREPPVKEDLEEIVVTGSHIRGLDPAGTKIERISGEEIRDSGYGRVQDFLANIPQNFRGANEENFSQNNGNSNLGAEVQLRGLGSGTTLTLVNGLRPANGGMYGAFVDVASIPVAAIERVEILSDGASAIYGSDAIGGVVNFILRSDFEGAATDVRYATASGEAEETLFSHVQGMTWEGANALVGYQYLKRGALPASSRPVTALGYDYTSLGGTDYRGIYQTFGSSPGTILDPRTWQPLYAIPSGQDGTSLTVSDLIPGDVNYTDVVSALDIAGPQDQHSAFAHGAVDVGAKWKVTADARYSTRDVVRAQAPRVVNAFVPNTNPFYVDAYGDGTPVLVAYDLAKDLGPNTGSGTTDTLGVAMTVVGHPTSEWQISFSGSYGREDVDSIADETSVAGSLAMALNAALADPNPQTALNVFGDGRGNNPDTLNQLRNTYFYSGVSTIWSSGVLVDGPLFPAPAGMAHVAIGADYRYEKQEITTGTSVFSDLRSSAGDRNVRALFSELLVPMVGEAGKRQSGPRLDLSIAARYEEYSDFSGSSFDPKVGLTFSPMREFALRATWGTSFRAPRFYQTDVAIAGGSVVQAAFEPDPTSASGSSKILRRFGNNPDLTEETAEVWTAGVDFTPPVLRDLTLSATYFHIAYRDKIESTRASLILEDQFSGLILRNPSQALVDELCASATTLLGDCSGSIAAILDNRINNIAVLNVNGIDFDITYGAESQIGDWRFGIKGSKFLEYQRAFTETAPSFDVVDTIRNPVSLRFRGYLGWTRQNVSAALGVNYTGSYENNELATSEPIDSFTTVDTSATYEFSSGGGFSGLRLSVHAVNVFDEQPPFVNIPFGYDGANSTLVGRLLSAQISKSW